MMLTTRGVTEAVYGSLMGIQRGWAYRYQYRVIVGVRVSIDEVIFLACQS